MLKPFLLRPACKNYLWGGTNLKTLYGKKSDLVPLAETWECSVHPDGPSIVDSGEYAGWTLAKYLENFPQALGKHGRENGKLPISIKLIDAEKDLSIQVHADKAFTRNHEQLLGKTKMWYVLHADPGATLVYGFAHKVTPELVRKAIAEDILLTHLQTVPVHVGDVFHIEPGTIHAIGGGVLLVEVQENSNVTYPVYDYGRRSENGEPRPMHIEKALSVMNFDAASTVVRRQRIVQYTSGMARELVARCRSFQVERLRMRAACKVPCTDETFYTLLITSGTGSLHVGEHELPVSMGETVFVPASKDTLLMKGDMEALLIRI